MHFFTRKASLIIAGTGILCFFSGCAKAPDAELAAAKTAVKAALDAEADKYMAKNFQNLQKAMEMAESEIAIQNNAFFLTRKYKRSTTLLQKATSLATELATEAPKLKADIVSQVKENLVLVKGMLGETADDIKKASRSKDKNVIEELKADLSAADSAAMQASADFNAGEVFKASDNLAIVQQLIKKITDTLNPKKDEAM